MYRGYDVHIRLKENTRFWAQYETGLNVFEENKITVRKTLEDFLLKNGRLDGSKMQKNWFPQVKADIFISHSHRNENQALALAGWLSSKFGITSFIDSCIWEYANDLLSEIDKTYTSKGSGYFSYEDRNHSTAHVHMMLSTALNMMIDKTECLFFLNTPESITSKSAIETKTTSPWIYSEIATSKIVRKRTPTEHRPKTKIFKARGGGKLLLEHMEVEVEYEMDFDHLTEINYDFVFGNWGKKIYSDKYTALDGLYSLTEEV